MSTYSVTYNDKYSEFGTGQALLYGVLGGLTGGGCCSSMSTAIGGCYGGGYDMGYGYGGCNSIFPQAAIGGCYGGGYDMGYGYGYGTGYGTCGHMGSMLKAQLILTLGESLVCGLTQAFSGIGFSGFGTKNPELQSVNNSLKEMAQSLNTNKKDGDSDSDTEGSNPTKLGLRTDFMNACKNYYSKETDANKQAVSDAYNELKSRHWSNSNILAIYKNIMSVEEA